MIFVGEVCPFSSGSWDSSEITGKNQAPDTGRGLALVSMNNSGLGVESQIPLELDEAEARQGSHLLKVLQVFPVLLYYDSRIY